MRTVANDLGREAAKASRDKASWLGGMAEAFAEAAEWEKEIDDVRKLGRADAALSVVRRVAIEVRASLAQVGATRHMCIVPAGWTGHPGRRVPSNLVLLVVTRCAESGHDDAATGLAPDVAARLPFAVTVCNAGIGAFQYHPSQPELPPCAMLQPCVHLPRVDAVVLRDKALVWMLALVRTTPTFFMGNHPSIYFCARP